MTCVDAAGILNKNFVHLVRAMDAGNKSFSADSVFNPATPGICIKPCK